MEKQPAKIYTPIATELIVAEVSTVQNVLSQPLNSEEQSVKALLKEHIGYSLHMAYSPEMAAQINSSILEKTFDDFSRIVSQIVTDYNSRAGNEKISNVELNQIIISTIDKVIMETGVNLNSIPSTTNKLKFYLKLYLAERSKIKTNSKINLSDIVDQYYDINK